MICVYSFVGIIITWIVLFDKGKLQFFGEKMGCYYRDGVLF